MVEPKDGVIVTGATGFLGTHLVKALEKQGWNVFAIGRDLLKGIELNSESTKFVYLDLTNRQQVHSELGEITSNQNIHAIIHCAALSSAWGKESDFIRNNVEATQHLLEAAQAISIQRFVFVSSTSVYFDFQDQFNISEDAPVARPFVNAYAKSKYLAEREVLKCKDAFETVIIRPRGLIGVGDPAIVPRILKVASRGWFPLIRNGEATIDITYVKNVAEALILAMSIPAAAGEIFNISNGEPVKVRALLERLFDLSGLECSLIKVPLPVMMASASAMELAASVLGNGEPIYTKYSAGLIATSQTLNIDKAKELLGYKPDYSLDFAIREYVDNMEIDNA